MEETTIRENYIMLQTQTQWGSTTMHMKIDNLQQITFAKRVIEDYLYKLQEQIKPIDYVTTANGYQP